MDPTIENTRIAALRKFGLLAGPPSEAFDRITRMAVQLFGLPQSTISFTDTDRVWFRSRVGVEHAWVDRSRAPCASVTETNDLLVVSDLQAHPYFKHGRLAASGVRFYAGAPLRTREGYALGSICVKGMAPRAFTDAERATLADLAAIVMAQIELQHSLGRIDPISGLANRNQFLDDMADLAKDRAPGETGIVALLNLANSHGLANTARTMHAHYLDDLSRQAAAALRQVAPDATRIYQVATAQFALILPRGADLDLTWHCVKRWIDARDAWYGSRFQTSPAAGIVPFVTGEVDVLDVLRMAESAVQDAHGSSSGVAVYSTAQDAEYRRRFWLVSAFEQALADPAQLRLVFQPRIDLGTGQCIGAEALMRWTQPEAGAISPAEFMPIIEQTSLAGPATSWVLDNVLRQVAAWRRQGMALPISANLPAANLHDPNLVGELTSLLARHGLDAGAIELEITESSAMGNIAAVQETFKGLQATGVRLAIDDFGTGYSSLSYLQDIPAHTIKIDQSFIRGLEADDRKQSLAEGIIGLAHSLGYRVVAEGVETAAASRWLRENACDEAQGYLYSRPLETDAFMAWVAASAVMAPG